MNKIHKFTMAIVAVVMIAGFSAFKIAETENSAYNLNETKSLTELWRFTGNNLDDVTDPHFYVKVDPNSPNCQGGEIICEIEAPENLITNKPALSEFVNSTHTYADLIEEAMDELDINDVVKSFRAL